MKDIVEPGQSQYGAHNDENLLGTVLQGRPYREVGGYPYGLHTVFARRGGSHQHVLGEMVRNADWQYAYVLDENALNAAVKAAKLPPLSAIQFPCEIVFAEYKEGVVFSSPIPDTLSMQGWLNDIVEYATIAANGIIPCKTMSAIIATISINRNPSKAARGAKSCGSVRAFFVEQFNHLESILERGSPLGFFPY